MRHSATLPGSAIWLTFANGSRRLERFVLADDFSDRHTEAFRLEGVLNILRSNQSLDAGAIIR